MCFRLGFSGFCCGMLMPYNAFFDLPGNGSDLFQQFFLICIFRNTDMQLTGCIGEICFFYAVQFPDSIFNFSGTCGTVDIFHIIDKSDTVGRNRCFRNSFFRLRQIVAAFAVRIAAFEFLHFLCIIFCMMMTGMFFI